MFQQNLKKIYYWYLLNRNQDIRRYVKSFNENQLKSADEIEHINWEKRKKLVHFAYNNVPYYRKKFDLTGFHPKDLVIPDDYSKIPLLKREDIKNNLDDIVPVGMDKSKLILSGTGGTTGEPLMLYKPKTDDGLMIALNNRMLKWWGVKPLSNNATAYRITNSNVTIKKQMFLINSRAPFLSLKNKMRQIISTQIQLDASYMNTETMNQFINEFRILKPEYLVGYVGAIDELARYIEDKNIELGVKPKAVWVTAAPLSKTARNNIERVFKTPVYDQYGSMEVFFIAAECKERNGLHSFYDSRHIEFINEHGLNTEANINGDVVITDLDNYFFPLIRYVNGDIGSWKGGECACGVNLPLINSIHGRSSDRIFLKDGSSISGEFLTTIFDDFAQDIKGFQVHQKSKERIEVKLAVLDKNRFSTITKIVGNELRKTTKGLIEIEFIDVKEIEHSKGKLRYVINDLKGKV